VIAPPPPPADDGEVRATYTMRRSDLLAAGVAASRQSITVNTIGAFAMAAGIASALITGVVGFFELVVPVVFGAAFLSGYAAGGITALAASRRPDLMQAPVELTANREGLTTRTSKARSEVRWSAYKRILVTGSLILLDVGTGAISMVPRHAFTDEELGRVLRWADAAGVLDRRPVWRSMAIGIALGIVVLVVLTAGTYLVARSLGGG
jgi:YcxB-like protein